MRFRSTTWWGASRLLGLFAVALMAMGLLVAPSLTSFGDRAEAARTSDAGVRSVGSKKAKRARSGVKKRRYRKTKYKRSAKKRRYKKARAGKKKSYRRYKKRSAKRYRKARKYRSAQRRKYSKRRYSKKRKGTVKKRRTASLRQGYRKPKKSLSGGGVRWVASSKCLNGSLRAVVYQVASKFGPVTVSSTCRSRSRNARVGGAKRSRHLTGSAVDFRVHANHRAAYAYLKRHGSVGGYKHYGGGLFHIDNGPRRTW